MFLENTMIFGGYRNGESLQGGAAPFKNHPFPSQKFAVFRVTLWLGKGRVRAKRSQESFLWLFAPRNEFIFSK
jgi:hypothetical protein